MFALTESAADAIRRLSETPTADGVRISTSPASTDGSETGLQIQLVAQPEAQDAVVEAEGARLYLEPEAADTLEDKVLDADIDGDSIQFAIFQQPAGGQQAENGPQPAA